MNIIISPHIETNLCMCEVHLATIHSSRRYSMDQLNEDISQHDSSLQNNCSDLNSQDKVMLERIQSQTLSQQQKRNLEQKKQQQQQRKTEQEQQFKVDQENSQQEKEIYKEKS